MNINKLTHEQLKNYLNKLHIDNHSLSPDYQTLKMLQYKHFNYISYENSDSINGYITSLAPQDLYEKLILKNRGGICF